jgi:hypothetical protein
VFYRTALAAWLVAVVSALTVGVDAARVSDLVVLLVLAFLAFGRVGCFRVACCHGRPARFGVRYTEAHARLGFPERWIGRPLFPVQLVEAAASAALAVTGTVLLASGATAGAVTEVLVVGYALVRFPLELLRGDAARPYAAGLSEAQWIAFATTLLVAIVRPAPATIVPTIVLGTASGVVAWWSRSFARSLRHPRHLDEIERTVAALRARPGREPILSSAGLKISVHPLPAARLDMLWSAAHLRERDAHALVRDLSLDAEIVPGQAPGLFHVVMER